jgi:leucine dehydrogenase
MRLARGMTHKWAALDFDSGGGKAVLAVPERLDGDARRSLLLDYGRLVESLGGAFSTGRDLGTTDDDMRTLAEVTRHVHGVDRATGVTRDPGPYTARGVAAAIGATLGGVFGSSAPAGRTVLIQGVGGVGAPLARRLAAAGATLLLSDVDSSRVEALAAELGAATVHAEAAIDTACDLYAPCALGATLDARSIPRLRCRAVAGSANNQLGQDADADLLHARGILYAPDFIANGGGALAFGLIHRGVTDEAAIGERLDGIAATLGDLFREAAAKAESPQRAALRRIEARLARRSATATDP